MPLIPLSFEPAGLSNVATQPAACFILFIFLFFSFPTDLVPVKCLVKSTRQIDSAAAGALSAAKLKALSSRIATPLPTLPTVE